MLDSIGIEVLQLDLVVVQQPLKKSMSRGSEPALMEVHERYHVAVGRRWHILLTNQQPLLGRGPCTKKSTTDEALRTLEGDVRAAPRIHWKMGVDGCELDNGWDADAGSLKRLATTVVDAKAMYETRGPNPLVL